MPVSFMMGGLSRGRGEGRFTGKGGGAAFRGEGGRGGLSRATRTEVMAKADGDGQR